MQFSTAFIVAALPFLATASYLSEQDYSNALYRRAAALDFDSNGEYVTLQARADRDKTWDNKATEWTKKNSAHPKKTFNAAENVAGEAMKAGAAGPDGLNQNANIRAAVHHGGSQAHGVVTTTTGHRGDQHSTTNHFGASGPNLQNMHWDGTNQAYQNDNKGKTKVVKDDATRHWDRPGKRSLYRRHAEAIAAAEAEAYAAAYADAYEEALALHKRDLEMDYLYERDLNMDFEEADLF